MGSRISQSLSCILMASTEMLHVILQASNVMSECVMLVTSWDLCNDNDLITFKRVEKLALEGREFVLSIEGIGWVETTFITKLYDVLASIKKGQDHVWFVPHS